MENFTIKTQSGHSYNFNKINLDIVNSTIVWKDTMIKLDSGFNDYVYLYEIDNGNELCVLSINYSLPYIGLDIYSDNNNNGIIEKDYSVFLQTENEFMEYGFNSTFANYSDKDIITRLSILM